MAFTTWAAQVLQWLVQRVAKRQRRANPIKTNLSSDCGLQLDRMKLESLVTVGQLYHGEYVLEPCTHRPSSQPSRQGLKPRLAGLRPGR